MEDWDLILLNVTIPSSKTFSFKESDRHSLFLLLLSYLFISDCHTFCCTRQTDVDRIRQQYCQMDGSVRLCLQSEYFRWFKTCYPMITNEDLITLAIVSHTMQAGEGIISVHAMSSRINIAVTARIRNYLHYMQ